MTTAPRERTRIDLFAALGALAALIVAASVLLRLSAYGIWDPWELSVADAARKLGEGAAEGQGFRSLSLRLVQASFALFGTREWAGRLPNALSGLVLLLAVGLWVRRFSSNRAAIYALLALGTTPLFLLHCREMVGATPSFLCAALVAIGASNAVFPGRDAAPPPAYEVWLWLACALAFSVLGMFTTGALLSALPSLLAVAAAALLSGAPFDRRLAKERRSAAWVVVAGAALVAALVARAVFRHAAEHSVWTGGVPLDEAVPSYERVISHLFHGLAPWSALAPVAVGALLWRSAKEPHDAALRLVCTLWAGFAYAAATIFVSSYGSAAFPAPAAVAIGVALWLGEVDEQRESYWPELTIALLMLGLLLRDYVLYPSSPLDGLELAQAQAPDRFNPKASWSILFGAFGFALLLSCMATRERGTLDLRAPYRALRASWDVSTGHRAWLVCLGVLWLGLVIFAALALIQPPGVRLTSIARRVGRAAGALALLAPVLVALGQVLFHESRRLWRARNLPLFVAALALGVYASQLFLPKLSAHFSPREVFDMFERMASDKEPLAQHQVHGRAAAYYVQREVRDIASEPELVNYLSAAERRWALLPSERLADIDVAFRRRTGRHLFLPSAENARVSLLANLAVPGKKDENPLAKYVLKTAPPVEHPLGANFDGRIELIGYNLELPQRDYVGAGQSFTVVWVYRVLRGNIGAYQAFLHVDAEGQRINGDHDPVDGMYPVRLWDEGDIVVDRQRVSVPATNPPGTYTMYTGFFRGESRMKIQSGPKDDSDRVIAGSIQIR